MARRILVAAISVSSKNCVVIRGQHGRQVLTAEGSRDAMGNNR